MLRGESPADWRDSVYYRYYHDPGHHDTRAHYGVRTKTHKLIYYWNKDVYELYNLVDDPTEQHNLLYALGDLLSAQTSGKFEELKNELKRLQAEFKDEGQYADPATWPKGGSDGPFDGKELIGTRSIAQAIAEL